MRRSVVKLAVDWYFFPDALYIDMFNSLLILKGWVEREAYNGQCQGGGQPSSCNSKRDIGALNDFVLCIYRENIVNPFLNQALASTYSKPPPPIDFQSYKKKFSDPKIVDLVEVNDVNNFILMKKHHH